MTPLFDRLEDQLRAAAQAQLASEAPQRSPRSAGGRWLRAGGRALPVVLSLGATVAVVLLAVVFLHGRGSGSMRTGPRPGHGRSTPSASATGRELAIIERMTNGVLTRGVCVDGPAVTKVPRPSAAQLDELAVLRRPQSAADRRSFGDGVAGLGPFRSVWTRRARVVDGVSFLVVPDPYSDRPLPHHLGTLIGDGACLRAQAAAVRSHRAEIPARLRAAALRLEHERLVAGQRSLRGPRRDEICLVAKVPSPAPARTFPIVDGVNCGTPAVDPREAREPESIQVINATAIDYELVADGVASVSETWSEPSGGHRTYSGNTRGNIAAIVEPELRGGGHGARTARLAEVVWRTAGGRVISRYTSPDR